MDHIARLVEIANSPRQREIHRTAVMIEKFLDCCDDAFEFVSENYFEIWRLRDMGTSPECFRYIFVDGDIREELTDAQYSEVLNCLMTRGLEFDQRSLHAAKKHLLIKRYYDNKSVVESIVVDAITDDEMAAFEAELMAELAAEELGSELWFFTVRNHTPEREYSGYVSTEIRNGNTTYTVRGDQECAQTVFNSIVGDQSAVEIKDRVYLHKDQQWSKQLGYDYKWIDGQYIVTPKRHFEKFL